MVAQPELTDASGPSRPGTPVVRLEHVRKEYGPVHALDGVSLEILPGEVHCLAGENGAGKSTLIRVLSGATARDGGSYEVAGREVPVAMAPSEARELGIGVVYQELSLLPELSVMDNLFMGHFRHRAGVISRRRQRQEAREILDGVGLEAVGLDDLVGDLPTATRQMIEIARVLAAKARLVVFDEPTTALSEREAAALLERIQMLSSAGTAVLYVTHRLEEMFEIGDRVTVLRDGRSVTTHAMADLDENALIAAMVGREVTDLYPGQRPEPGPVRLKVSGLVPQGFEKPVDFAVRQGEIVGLAGLLGAGRTEILRAIFGAEPAESGAVEVDGATVTIRSPRAAVRNGIALLTEDRKESGLLAQLSIRENVTIASLDRTLQSGLGEPPSPAGAGLDGCRGPASQAWSVGRPDHLTVRRQPAEGPAWGGGWELTPRSCCSTSPPRVSTSAPSPTSTESSPGWQSRDWPWSSSRPTCPNSSASATASSSSASARSQARSAAPRPPSTACSN